MIAELLPAGERLRGERAARMKLVERAIPMNVAFLDDALGPILPHDLLMLGAETGAGKTQLASTIAELCAVKSGRRVDFFALEAEPLEIERRIKYRELVASFTEIMRNRAPIDRARISYREWYLGHLDDLFAPIDAVVEERLAPALSKMRTYYRSAGEFTLDDLERLFNMSKDEGAELIVLDHLHYVDDDDDNENRSGSRIMKRIRDVSLYTGVPSIVIAHLRKKNPAAKQIVPMLDDFHGTSNSVKIATKVVVLAPAFGRQQQSPAEFPTYCAVRKDRMDGAKRVVGLLTYKAREGRYADAYELGRLTAGGGKYEAIATDEYPSWSRFAPKQTEMNLESRRESTRPPYRDDRFVEPPDDPPPHDDTEQPHA